MQKKSHGFFVSQGNSEMLYLPPRVPHKGVSIPQLFTGILAGLKWKEHLHEPPVFLLSDVSFVIGTNLIPKL